MGIGDWGLGVWGWGVGGGGAPPNPTPHTPNPHSPIPNEYQQIIKLKNKIPKIINKKIIYLNKIKCPKSIYI